MDLLHFSWQLNTDIIVCCYIHNLLCSYLRRKRCLQSFLFLKGKVIADRVTDYSQISSYFQCILMVNFRTRLGRYCFASKRFLDLGQKSWPKYRKISYWIRAEKVGWIHSTTIFIEYNEKKSIEWAQNHFKLPQLLQKYERWKTPLLGFKGFIKSWTCFELYKNNQ